MDFVNYIHYKMNDTYSKYAEDDFSRNLRVQPC